MNCDSGDGYGFYDLQLKTLVLQFMFVFEKTANEQLIDNVHIFKEH